MCLMSGKTSYNMSSKITHNVSECVGQVQLPCKVTARPSELRLKIEHYYDAKLPTYEESQKKYVKYMKSNALQS